MKTFAVKEKRSTPTIRRSQPSRFGYRGPEVKAQQADHVADQVSAMPDTRLQRQPEAEEEEETLQAKPLAGSIIPFVQREAVPEEDEGIRKQPEEEEEIQGKLLQREADEEEESVQAKGVSGGAPAVSPSGENGINSIRGGGSPLPESTRNFFEPRFSADFSGMRVHTDIRAADLSKSINAKAFTLGNDVVFGAGQYAPRAAMEKGL